MFPKLKALNICWLLNFAWKTRKQWLHLDTLKYQLVSRWKVHDCVIISYTQKLHLINQFQNNYQNISKHFQETEWLDVPKRVINANSFTVCCLLLQLIWSAAGSVSMSVLMLLNICCSHPQTKDKNASKVRQNMQCSNFLQLSCIVMGLVAGAMLGSKCWDNIKYANYSNPTWSYSKLPGIQWFQKSSPACTDWPAVDTAARWGSCIQLEWVKCTRYSIALPLGLMILNYNFKRVTR